jgi:hypothetical protein
MKPGDGSLPLFDQPWNKPVAKDVGRSLEGSFRRYHAKNPHVLGLFIEQARRAYARGVRKAGAKDIAETLRWHSDFGADSDFKIPNAHVAFYARLVLHRAPDLGDFFDLATQKYPFDPATVTP